MPTPESPIKAFYASKLKDTKNKLKLLKPLIFDKQISGYIESKIPFVYANNSDTYREELMKKCNKANSYI